METKFYVEVSDPDVVELLEKKAEEAGYVWKNKNSNLAKSGEMCFGFWNNNDISWGNAANFLIKHDLTQALNYFSELKKEREKPKFTVDSYWRVNEPEHSEHGRIIKINKIVQSGSSTYCYYDGINEPVFNIGSVFAKSLIPATQKEIEAQKPVYKVGEHYKSVECSLDVEKDDICKLLSCNTVFGQWLNLRSNVKFEKGLMFFSTATPAEISAAQKVMIAGYEVKFCSRSIIVGGRDFENDSIKDLAHSMRNIGANGIIFHDCNGKEIKVDYETVQKVVERLK